VEATKEVPRPHFPFLVYAVRRVIADRRPFGDGFLAHPLVVFFIVVGAGLLAVRLALSRPVPEIIPDRLLLLGCFAGLAAFLVGNWLGTHVIPLLAGSPARLF